MLSSTNAILLNEEFNKQNHNHNGSTTLKLVLTTYNVLIIFTEKKITGQNSIFEKLLINYQCL